MTDYSHTLKAYRQALGLSIGQIVRHSSFANLSEATWRDFERGRSTTPPGVLDQCERLVKGLEEIAISQEKAIYSLLEGSESAEQLALLKYQEQFVWQTWCSEDYETLKLVELHHTLLSRAVGSLIHGGYDPIVVAFDPDAYMTWLDGRADMTELRSAWAATQL